MVRCVRTVAGHNVSLHSRGVELKCFLNLGDEAIMDTDHTGLPQFFVFNFTIRTTFVAVIQNSHRLPVYITHKTGIHAASMLIISACLTSWRAESCRWRNPPSGNGLSFDYR